MLRPDPASFGYSRTARLLHWISAALVFLLLALGITMIRLPAGTEAEAATVFRAFSLHKTLGVLALALTLPRLLHALVRPGPGSLHPERRAETLLASTVHLLLYLCLLLLPLTGLALDTAAPGYAPLYLPVQLHLPWVPVSDTVAAGAKAAHHALAWLLLAGLALHIAGALKHALVDRDMTLARMTTGEGTAVAPRRGLALPAALALVVASLAVAAGLHFAPPPPDPLGEIDKALQDLDTTNP